MDFKEILKSLKGTGLEVIEINQSGKPIKTSSGFLTLKDFLLGVLKTKPEVMATPEATEFFTTNSKFGPMNSLR